MPGRPAARRDRRPVPHPAPAPRPGATSPTACRGRCARWPRVRGVTDERLAVAPGVTPSGCFGSPSCRPARRVGCVGRNGPRVRRSARRRSALAVCHSVGFVAHRRYRSVIAKPGWGTLPSIAVTMVGALPSHTASAVVTVLLPGPTRSGCHVVDVSARSRRRRHRRVRGVRLIEPPGTDVPERDVPGDDLLGELENLDDWLTQQIPVVPPTSATAHRVLRRRSRPASRPPCAAPPRPRRPAGGRTASRRGARRVAPGRRRRDGGGDGQDGHRDRRRPGPHVHTFAADVAAALRGRGHRRGARRTASSPPLPTELDNGDHVIFSRARKLTLVEGPSQREVWTTAASVDEALRGLGRAGPADPDVDLAEHHDPAGRARRGAPDPAHGHADRRHRRQDGR